jgi:thioredoxin-like negative regulator of GroEL
MFKVLTLAPKTFVVIPTRKFATFKLQESSEFQEKVIKASHKTPVIVDCKADWCGPWYH